MTISLRERRRQMLRDEILNVAHMLVAKKGYAAVSMDDLAAEVGISKPTLYSHFDTKEELVIAAVVRKMELFLVEIEARPAERTPLEHLLLIMRKLIQRHMDDRGDAVGPWSPGVFQLLCSDPGARDQVRRMDAAIVALVQQGIDAGQINPALDVSMLGKAFFALSTAPNLAHVTQTPVESFKVAVITLMTLFMNGVKTAGTCQEFPLWSD